MTGARTLHVSFEDQLFTRRWTIASLVALALICVVKSFQMNSSVIGTISVMSRPRSHFLASPSQE